MTISPGVRRAETITVKTLQLRRPVGRLGCLNVIIVANKVPRRGFLKSIRLVNTINNANVRRPYRDNSDKRPRHLPRTIKVNRIPSGSPNSNFWIFTILRRLVCGFYVYRDIWEEITGDICNRLISLVRNDCLVAIRPIFVIRRTTIRVRDTFRSILIRRSAVIVS